MSVSKPSTPQAPPPATDGRSPKQPPHPSRFPPEPTLADLEEDAKRIAERKDLGQRKVW